MICSQFIHLTMQTYFFFFLNIFILQRKTITKFSCFCSKWSLHSIFWVKIAYGLKSEWLQNSSSIVFTHCSYGYVWVHVIKYVRTKWKQQNFNKPYYLHENVPFRITNRATVCSWLSYTVHEEYFGLPHRRICHSLLLMSFFLVLDESC